MAIKFNMQGATPKSGVSLCKTCKYAKFVNGQNGEELARCEAFHRFFNFKVNTCTAFHPSNIPFLWEMETIAWSIEARQRGPAGFKPGESNMEYVIKPPVTHSGDDVPEED